MPVTIGDQLTLALQTTLGGVQPVRGLFYVADDTTSPATTIAGDLPENGFPAGEDYSVSGWAVSYDDAAQTFAVTVGTNYAGQPFHVGTRVGAAGTNVYHISETVPANGGGGGSIPPPTLSATGLLVANVPVIRLTGH